MAKHILIKKLKGDKYQMNKKLTLTVIAVLVLLVGFFGIKNITNKYTEQSTK